MCLCACEFIFGSESLLPCACDLSPVLLLILKYYQPPVRPLIEIMCRPAPNFAHGVSVSLSPPGRIFMDARGRKGRSRSSKSSLSQILHNQTSSSTRVLLCLAMGVLILAWLGFAPVQASSSSSSSSPSHSMTYNRRSYLMRDSYQAPGARYSAAASSVSYNYAKPPPGLNNNNDNNGHYGAASHHHNYGSPGSLAASSAPIPFKFDLPSDIK